MDIVGGEEGLQGLKLEHPESREVARGEIEVGTGETSPSHPQEVFGIKLRSRTLPSRQGSRGSWEMSKPDANLRLTRVITPARPL